MPVLLASLNWVAMTLISGATLGLAIAAGRATRGLSRASFLVAELLSLAVALVGWGVEAWFLAQAFMGAGMRASVAVIVGTVCGSALVVVAAVAGGALVRTGYALSGNKDSFSSDLNNSLWVSRGPTWRPRDFRSESKS